MKKENLRKGFVFKTYEAPEQSLFDQLFEIFKGLITHTSGDFDEAMDWLKEDILKKKLSQTVTDQFLLRLKLSKLLDNVLLIKFLVI
mgnify:CR=1 FL=1